MGPKVMAFVIAATFALEACGQPESAPGAGLLPCNPGICKTDVTVANNDCSSAANIKVARDPSTRNDVCTLAAPPVVIAAQKRS